MLPPVNRRLSAIEEVGQFCDVQERLALIPPSALVRGLYFRSIDKIIAKAGKTTQFLDLFPDKITAIRWYPLAEYITRLTVASALIYGPERVHEGMFQIGRENAMAFADSLVGKVLLRLLSRNPRKVLEQGVAGRRQSCTFGRWTLTFPDDYTAVMEMSEEYLFIESYLLGAAQGTFDAIGIAVHAEAKLVDRFTGTHTLRWSASSASEN
jgi:uncharacterized protein (TIGR02265 family)